MSESIYKRQLSSGLTCYVIPKKGYVEKLASLSVNYGSADARYSMGGKPVETPQGVAHFLEHKMFESEHGNVFQQFNQQNALVNAYTTFSNTAYYFNTVGSFEDNLSLLLCFTREPYFTDENVEKEKGIIAQEIDMYRDDPQWRLYINLHRALFRQIPVREDIAGTVESISAINKEILYQCHKTFYTLGNMVLVCTGDLDAEQVFGWAEEYGQTGESSPEFAPERNYGDEPPKSAVPHIEERMSVTIPMFMLGFKDKTGGTGKTIAASRILSDIVAGESSPLFATLYDGGFVDNTFSVSYIGGAFYGTTLFNGSGREPLRASEMMLEEIERLKDTGIPPARFDIIKHKAIGRYLRGMNSLDSLTASQADLHAKGLDVFSLLDAFYSVTLNDVEERLHSHLREDGHALSVIWPNA